MERASTSSPAAPRAARQAQLGVALTLGLLVGLLWAPVYGPYDPDWMASASASVLGGAALSTLVAATWVGIGAHGFRAALGVPAGTAWRPVGAIMLAVFLGFAAVVAITASLDPATVAWPRLAAIWAALTATGALALGAAAAWRGLLDLRGAVARTGAVRRAPAPDRPRPTPSPDDPWVGSVRPPSRTITLAAALCFCLALGWFAQLLGIVLPEGGGWRKVGGLVAVLGLAALALTLLAGLASRWVGRMAGAALVVVLATAAAAGATARELRPFPASWSLAAIEPGGRALELWVWGSCPNAPRAEVARRTADRIEIRATLKPPVAGSLGCALMDAGGPAGSELVRVSLDRPLDGERIAGPGLQRADPRLSLATPSQIAMPNVVGLAPQDALVLLGADRPPRSRASRERGRFAYRLGDVTFEPRRERVVTAQEPAAGAPLERGIRQGRDVPRVPGGRYTAITLTTGR